MTAPAAPAAGRHVEQTDSVVVRFAGDSGDGVQVTGSQFTRTSALVGNDIATLPNFPAEIRAPAGTLFGVSGFQIQLGAIDIRTPGDTPDALVAFNPAALKVNLGELKKGGLILANAGAFSSRNLDKAGYSANPLEDDSLAGYQVVSVDMTSLTRAALEGSALKTKDKDRSKNFFALGMVYYLYGRPLEHTIEWVEGKFGKKPAVASANVKALKTGYHYAETSEAFVSTYSIAEAPIAPGRYRRVTGNLAAALGLVAATQRAGLDLFLGSYPITPASDLLHNLAGLRAHGVRTLQAEDEIAAICAAIGASYAGQLGVCSTSGPGLALKGEALGLAMMLELPLVVVDVQRGGPSTGLPTKTEQSDYNIAVFGRNGDAPLPVLAARSPADCFDAAYEAARITVKYRTPVVLLTDGYLANGSEPWKIPDEDSLRTFTPDFHTEVEGFLPYARDPETLARPWIKPGTPGLEHRVGGLEKAEGTGDVSYDPANHHRMSELRAEKVRRVTQEMSPLDLIGEREGDLLVIGWGSTWGAISSAIKQVRAEGKRVSSVHLRWLFPLHEDLGDLISGFDKILVPEMNMGQLVHTIRGRYLVDAQSFNQVTGLPFNVGTIRQAIDDLLNEEA